MKILHVYKDFDPPVRGGMERHMSMMCRYQREWADVEAMTCSRSVLTSVVDRDGTKVTEVGELGRFQGAPLALKFPLYLKMAKADVIVVHVPNPTAELSWLLMRPKAKLVVRYQSDVVRQARAMKYYNRYQQAFLKLADTILVSSQEYLETSKSLAPFKEKCRVVPLGIEHESFGRSDEHILNECYEHYGKNYVLFAGRHRYYKGLHVLVQAAKDIDATVVIAGDGPERNALMQQAKELGVNIEFPGLLSDEGLAAHLKGAGVVAFPSVARSEAYGLGILEAHAAGKPVVATQLGTGVEFVNQDGETGFNVPPGDSDALAASINTLLYDSSLRERLGKQAQERARNEFEARTIAEMEYSIYQEVLDAK